MIVRGKHSSLFRLDLSDEENTRFIALAPVANIVKLFTVVNYECSKQARVFVLGRPFQPNLKFVRKAKAHRSRTPISRFTLG